MTIHSPIFDSYDHWTGIDERLASYKNEVSIFPQTIGKKLLHMSIYAHHMDTCIATIRSDPRAGQELADLEAFTEAFLVSARSACDEIAAFISRTCVPKPGQAPPTLRKLIHWAQRHPEKIMDGGLLACSDDFRWFEKLRRIRDTLVHFGGDPWISTNGRDFRVVVQAHHGAQSSIDEDLPLLLQEVAARTLLFADQAGEAINKAIALPDDRRGSRVLLGCRLETLTRRRSPDH